MDLKEFAELIKALRGHVPQVALVNLTLDAVIPAGLFGVVVPSGVSALTSVGSGEAAAAMVVISWVSYLSYLGWCAKDSLDASRRGRPRRNKPRRP